MTNLQAASSPPLLGRRALDLRSLRERYGVVLALIALCAALALANPHFMTWGNWADILRQTSINGILAIGMTCVVLTAGIDLSVGAILALAGMVGAWLAADGQGLAVSVGAGLGVGMLLGGVNGLLVAWFAVPPFVATLGMLSAARGLTYIYNDGMPVSELPEGFLAIGAGQLGPEIGRAHV